MEILNTKEFNNFYKIPYKKLSTTNWTIHYQVLSTSVNCSDTGLVGISVSKKVFKQAYKRNKIKRQIKSWLAGESFPGFKINIILTKPLILQDKALAELKNQLFQILKKIKND